MDDLAENPCHAPSSPKKNSKPSSKVNPIIPSPQNAGEDVSSLTNIAAEGEEEGEDEREEDGGEVYGGEVDLDMPYDDSYGVLLLLLLLLLIFLLLLLFWFLWIFTLHFIQLYSWSSAKRDHQ